MIGVIGFAFLAGILSTLSPCVLPLLPLLLGAALSEHRFGPVALASGVALSFMIVGIFVATIGFAIGLDAGVFRTAAAFLLVGIGVVLLVPRFQARFAIAAGPLGNWAEERFGSFSMTGFFGQFAVGLLLGVVWTPCVGPTLGAASVMAARGRELGEVALTMFAFGVGAAMPLLMFGMVSRETMMRFRARLMLTGQSAKIAMGAVLTGAGVVILSGFDKSLEIILVDASPSWLTNFTTHF